MKRCPNGTCDLTDEQVVHFCPSEIPDRLKHSTLRLPERPSHEEKPRERRDKKAS